MLWLASKQAVRASTAQDQASRSNSEAMRLAAEDELGLDAADAAEQGLGGWKHRVVWEPDEEADECRVCEHAFSATRRKHHCRQCGRVVCGQCSEREKLVPGYGRKRQRTCDDCFDRPADGGGPLGTVLALCAHFAAACVACFEAVRPLLVTLGLADTPQLREKRRCRAALEKGAKFERASGVGGRISAALTFGALGTDEVFMRLDPSAFELVVSGTGERAAREPETFPLNLAAKAEQTPSAPTRFTVSTAAGATLLELEAKNRTMCATFVKAINDALEDTEVQAADVPAPSTVSGRAARKAHFVKREVELASKKRSADALKAKYMKGTSGLKYTALAMANRD